MSQSRREFLKSVVGASTVLSLSPATPSFLTRTALAAGPVRETEDTVLVVLQLSGGNDGLNTVVPYDDDVYGRGRSTLRLTGSEVHKIDDSLGFHPQMQSFQRLYREGRLSVVQGVGYPKSNRDHDGALRDWHTAQPGEGTAQTGWLGRAIDQEAYGDGAQVTGALVSPIPLPFALNAERAVVPSMRTAEQWIMRASDEERSHRERLLKAIDKCEAGPQDQLVDLVRRGTLAAHAGSKQVEDVLRRPSEMADYPGFTLAKHLRTVAELIRADLGIRIFFTELGGGGIGGFDNHANQRDNHAALLREFSESVSAFMNDLQKARRLDRVVLMTFSEFGRTVSENGRRGTGHGAAAPVFLAGGRLKGGLVGRHPSLSDLEGDAPKFHTDFRRVYATMLDRWLGFDSQPILGKAYEPLDAFA
jgi:uncharacterized protein (DUF1501 family)